MKRQEKPRVYRGAPRPLVKGSCSVCHKVVGTTETGRRRLHQDDGVECPGSGVLVEVTSPSAEVLSAARIQVPGLRAGRAGVDNGPCPSCGRRMPRNNDGSVRAHRSVADDPLAPHCPEGGDHRRSLNGGRA